MMYKIMLLGAVLYLFCIVSCSQSGNPKSTGDSPIKRDRDSSVTSTGDNSAKSSAHIVVDTASKIKESNQSKKKKFILIFGNSLTAGYGLQDQSESFPSILQGKIDSLKLPYKIINGGLSGETSAGGKNRIAWLLKNKVDIFVLELGANDGLRGIPVSETRTNLQSIIGQVKAKYPSAKLIMTGMMVPPNMGELYSNQFKVIFSELAEKNKMALVPFLLENVAGKPELNQADGIHPTAKGAKIVAGTVWKVLKDEIKSGE